jgi:hypothetical protein
VRSIIEESFRNVIGFTASQVRPLGFTTNGTIFRILDKGNAGIIEFQKSTKSSQKMILFTINLAVICGLLLRPDEPPVNKARSLHGHLRLRIGMLLPGHPDKWWEITKDTDVDRLATEISTFVSTLAVPYVQRYLQTDELIGLWESGKSPGLTEMQRIRFLRELAGNSKE